MLQLTFIFENSQQQDEVLSLLNIHCSFRIKTFPVFLKICPECGSGHNKRTEYCSTKCYQRKWHRDIYKPRQLILTPIEKECIICARKFSSRRINTKYCSRRCIQIAWKQRHGKIKLYSSKEAELRRKLEYLKRNYPSPKQRPERIIEL